MNRQIEVLPGAHLVASAGGVVVVVAHRSVLPVTPASIAGRTMTALLGIVRRVAADEPRRSGRTVARHATNWLMSLGNGDEDEVEFGVLTPTDTGLAVFLHGGVSAILDAGPRTEILRGREAGFTVDRVLLPAPSVGAGLFVDEVGLVLETLPTRGVFTLTEGTTPGAGAILWFGANEAALGDSDTPHAGGAAGSAAERHTGPPPVPALGNTPSATTQPPAVPAPPGITHRPTDVRTHTTPPAAGSSATDLRKPSEPAPAQPAAAVARGSTASDAQGPAGSTDRGGMAAGRGDAPTEYVAAADGGLSAFAGSVVPRGDRSPSKDVPPSEGDAPTEFVDSGAVESALGGSIRSARAARGSETGGGNAPSGYVVADRDSAEDGAPGGGERPSMASSGGDAPSAYADSGAAKSALGGPDREARVADALTEYVDSAATGSALGGSAPGERVAGGGASGSGDAPTEYVDSGAIGSGLGGSRRGGSSAGRRAADSEAAEDAAPRGDEHQRRSMPSAGDAPTEYVALADSGAQGAAARGGAVGERGADAGRGGDYEAVGKRDEGAAGGNDSGASSVPGDAVEDSGVDERPTSYMPPAGVTPPRLVKPSNVVAPPSNTGPQERAAHDRGSGPAHYGGSASEIDMQETVVPTSARTPHVPEVASSDPGVVIKGFKCARDHLNDPRVSFCAVCGIRMDQLTCVLTDGVRPPLGLLLLDDGTSFVLDADCVLGREPEHAEAVSRGARPVRLEDRSGGMSRAHAEIRLVDWDVTVVDGGSTNGTHIRQPGHQDWSRAIPGHPVKLIPGAQVQLGSRVVTFDSQHGQL
ncbi:FHA domain-containing protein [Nocardia brasiliensis]|uniref:FHA domain-containing protein n=1 Tax=Nocardia brasiliensis TaxID=37326 RepID=UPI00245814E2|nr:FHA domain-containing protein [Nocardia brasiliensis]